MIPQPTHPSLLSFIRNGPLVPVEDYAFFPSSEESAITTPKGTAYWSVTDAGVLMFFSGRYDLLLMLPPGTWDKIRYYGDADQPDPSQDSVLPQAEESDEPKVGYWRAYRPSPTAMVGGGVFEVEEPHGSFHDLDAAQRACEEDWLARNSLIAGEPRITWSRYRADEQPWRGPEPWQTHDTEIPEAITAIGWEKPFVMGGWSIAYRIDWVVIQ